MCGYGLRMVQNIGKRIGQGEINGESRYTKRNGLEGWVSIVWVETSESMVQNIRKRIGQRVIYGESRYTKRNGLEGWVEDGPKYKEKDWTNSYLRGVQIYEEEWTGGVDG